MNLLFCVWYKLGFIMFLYIGTLCLVSVIIWSVLMFIVYMEGGGKMRGVLWGRFFLVWEKILKWGVKVVFKILVGCFWKRVRVCLFILGDRRRFGSESGNEVDVYLLERIFEWMEVFISRIFYFIKGWMFLNSKIR